MNEIGSEFHLPLSINEQSQSNINIIKKPYTDYVYTRSGREAIGFVLDEITPRTKVALLPTYICNSMLEPFLKKGYSVEYFSIDRDFNPNLKEFAEALGKEPDVILVIDWFGMDKNQEVVSLARKHSQKIVVITDCSHNYFNELMMIESDYIIASLRKWFALPDGAIAINCRSHFLNNIEFSDNLFYKNRKEALRLKNDYLLSRDQNLKTQYRELLLSAEHSLEINRPVVGISEFSLSLINKLNIAQLKIKRVENFNALFNLLDRSICSPILKTLANNESPFCFPILVDNNRDKLQAWLANNGIYCPVLWPLPEFVYDNYYESAYLSDSILAIPCDQRYSMYDMEYISNVIRKFTGRS
ncbi:hypothetical protein [Paenibacillus sp. HJGM_3]|uniref:hypothetical protein n=1 Tax=Paenibacillus sp. HJGM_3 TaxID=3379816 RepID=UPI00385F4E1B